MPITEITLDQNNWNLIGYPMQLNGQTRTMIKDNADILNINDLKRLIIISIQLRINIEFMMPDLDTG